MVVLVQKLKKRSTTEKEKSLIFDPLFTLTSIKIEKFAINSKILLITNQGKYI